MESPFLQPGGIFASSPRCSWIEYKIGITGHGINHAKFRSKWVGRKEISMIRYKARTCYTQRTLTWDESRQAWVPGRRNVWGPCQSQCLRSKAVHAAVQQLFMYAQAPRPTNKSPHLLIVVAAHLARTVAHSEHCFLCLYYHRLHDIAVRRPSYAFKGGVFTLSIDQC